MPEDILKQTAQIQKQTSPKKKVSVLGVLFTIILAVVLILLGERIIFDLNRVANPKVEKSVTSSTSKTRDLMMGQSAPLSSEGSGLSNSMIYYPTLEKGEYLTYKLLIHSAFIIPIFLLTFLFHYLFVVKKKYPHFQVVMYAYLVFAFWMLFHLLGELAIFVSDEFPNSAIYIILGVLVVLFTTLAVFVQKKVQVKD